MNRIPLTWRSNEFHKLAIKTCVLIQPADAELIVIIAELLSKDVTFLIPLPKCYLSYKGAYHCILTCQNCSLNRRRFSLTSEIISDRWSLEGVFTRSKDYKLNGDVIDRQRSNRDQILWNGPTMASNILRLS